MAHNNWDSKTSKWYASNYGDHPSNDKIVELADLQNGDHILDIGCGSGTAVFSASKMSPQGKAIGLDPSLTMIQIANEKLAQLSSLANIQFIEGGAEQIPTADNTFDVVLALNSLHHWSDVAKGIGEVKRVLKWNGRVLIGEEQFEDRINEWTPEKVLQAFTKAGFEKLSHSVVQFEDCTMDFIAFLPNEN